MKNKILGGIIGLVVGDALGVPVEFENREALAENPVVSMRENGSHEQPKGTWSDDSSMTLCLMASLLNGVDFKDLFTRFQRWAEEGYLTAHGEIFDIGKTTLTAILNFEGGLPPLECGGSGEYNNGNGSLMRILPLAFYTFGKKRQERFELVHAVSKLTHGHERSLVACGIYVQLACELLKGYSKEKAYSRMIEECKSYYKEEALLAPFHRVLDGALQDRTESEISSSGYVVDSLEAALWCFFTTTTYADCVLKAVNLGSDTDTIAAIAGGLAGIVYGREGIPKEWIDCIVKREDIEGLCCEFAAVCKPFASLYAYIPYLESAPTYSWGGGKREDNVIIMPYPKYDKTLYAFTELPYELGLMDYSYHETLQQHGLAMGDKLKNAIPTANMELLLAILTAYVRGERFCEGLWVGCVKNGIFTVLLNRLKELESLS